MEATHLEPGMTPKRKLYNILVACGVFLPDFNANCLNIESLENHRNKKFHFYFAEALKSEIQSKTVLNAPPDFAYELVQRFHIQKYNKPLPYRLAPTVEYLKVIVKHIDPENNMELLKFEWTSRYSFNIMEIQSKIYKWEVNQGQYAQKAIDAHLNLAYSLRNAYFGHKLSIFKLQDEFQAVKDTITNEDAVFMSRHDLLLLSSPDTTSVYKKIVDDILQANDSDLNVYAVDNDEPTLAIHVAEMSDVGEGSDNSLPEENESKLKEKLHTLKNLEENPKASKKRKRLEIDEAMEIEEGERKEPAVYLEPLHPPPPIRYLAPTPPLEAPTPLPDSTRASSVTKPIVTKKSFAGPRPPPARDTFDEEKKYE